MKQQHASLINKLDWTTVGLYLLLVFIGWINIYASVYNEDHSSIFDLSQRYGMQLIWIISSFILAMMIMIFDQKFFSVFAYIIYVCVILLLILVLFAGVKINGSQSWFIIGSFRIQPAELSKVATSLALARLMSQYNFKLQNFSNLLKIVFIIGLPIILIFMQHDTGSALVFFSLLIMLYHEGLSGWFVGIVAFVAVLFILSIIWTPLSVLMFLWIICLLLHAFFNRSFFSSLIVGALSFGLYTFLVRVIFPYFEYTDIPYTHTFLVVCMITFIIGVVLAFKKKIRLFWVIFLFFAGSVVAVSSVGYLFDKVLKPHQQARIENVLGIQEDLQGVGYNVHQSKVAIGSGGVIGKGFLQGTQTRYNFVPEQSTDFIFCTVGEEWGFFGTTLLITIYLIFLIRIINISERQRDNFARIYGYCAVSIFSFHILVNIAMTIGLAPVIGIPLPFISYGGSSLWAFTMLLFILLKFDAVRWK